LNRKGKCSIFVDIEMEKGDSRESRKDKGERKGWERKEKK
jgi:hypothetical protein